VASARVVAKLPGHEGIIRDLTYHSGLRTLVTGSFDKSIRLWPISPDLAGNMKYWQAAVSSGDATARTSPVPSQ
jgi:WD40 repeat protein